MGSMEWALVRQNRYNKTSLWEKQGVNAEVSHRFLDMPFNELEEQGSRNFHPRG